MQEQWSMVITFRPEKKNPNNWRIFLSTKISILQHGTPNMIKPQPDWPLHCLRWLNESVLCLVAKQDVQFECNGKVYQYIIQFTDGRLKRKKYILS